MDSINVCWSPVRELGQALEKVHLSERGMVFVGGEGNHHPGNPIQF
ncbi:hypothetical protein PVT68_00575 [Microbulbifer bruguierae]|uniref:Uncharacterized protein n=1 Tax=Microbulbifer bruguierae TaxID=3029061 RepID=A0ABY8NEJ3_9GAMM|nr:hypothetical protein [Microbulbifer bruguierae]WGL16809.1 hypothetical protein PVT68_00575 [Microbulbifer bruguierae]